MKKTISLLGGLVLILLSASLYAQDTNAPVNRWDPAKNPTVDSITAPFRGKMLPPRPALTQADIFPVVGKYSSSTSTEAPNVTVVLDEQNKGLVWIDGLPLGRIKAYLRQSPSTYKIPVQKTEDGKDVAEGTLIFDKTSGTLNLVIGKTYNVEDPSSAFMIASDENGAAVAEGNTDKAVTDVDNKDKAADQDKMVADHEKKVVLKDKNTKTKMKVKTKKVEEPKPWTWSGTKIDATASAQ
jgi:hypothetical protein